MHCGLNTLHSTVLFLKHRRHPSNIQFYTFRDSNSSDLYTQVKVKHIQALIELHILDN